MSGLTEKEIRNIVKATINELKRSGYFKRLDDIAYSEISLRLTEYFKNPDSDPEMAQALESIRGDRYYRIITLYYRDHLTIDWIAEEFNCEISTITRNKKRLCLKIYHETE